MNPASRLHSIIQFFSSVHPNTSIRAAWLNYMGQEPTPNTDDEVLDVIQAVLAEIRSMETKLRSLGVPEEVFVDCISQLRTGFSPTQLSTPWATHQQNMLQSATPLTLQWAAWSLGKFNENEVDEKTVAALRESLVSQEQLLADTEMPQGLREMLERQVVGLRRALHLYKIQGIGPLQKIVTDSVGELATASQELVKEVEASPLATKNAFEQGKKMIGKAAELADKGSKVVKFGKEVYELGMNGWHIGQNLLILTA
jgi:hypothetical protein